MLSLSGPTVPQCLDERSQFYTAFRHQCGPGRWPRPGKSSWPLVVTDTCCCRAKDPDIALGGSTGQDLTMPLGGTTNYSHWAVSHYCQVSSSASFHCAYILLLPSLIHLSTTYLLILMMARASRCLGSPQGLPYEWCAMHFQCGYREGVISAVIC